VKVPPEKRKGEDRTHRIPFPIRENRFNHWGEGKVPAGGRRKETRAKKRGKKMEQMYFPKVYLFIPH